MPLNVLAVSYRGIFVCECSFLICSFFRIYSLEFVSQELLAVQSIFCWTQLPPYIGGHVDNLPSLCENGHPDKGSYLINQPFVPLSEHTECLPSLQLPLLVNTGQSQSFKTFLRYPKIVTDE